MESLFNEKTKGILLNNPLNPIGKVYTYQELEFIAGLAKKYNTIIISDEAHEWVTHKPHIRIGMINYCHIEDVKILFDCHNNLSISFKLHCQECSRGPFQ